MQVLGEMCQNR